MASKSQRIAPAIRTAFLDSTQFLHWQFDSAESLHELRLQVFRRAEKALSENWRTEFELRHQKLEREKKNFSDDKLLVKLERIGEKINDLQTNLKILNVEESLIVYRFVQTHLQRLCSALEWPTNIRYAAGMFFQRIYAVRQSIQFWNPKIMMFTAMYLAYRTEHTRGDWEEIYRHISYVVEKLHAATSERLKPESGEGEREREREREIKPYIPGIGQLPYSWVLGDMPKLKEIVEYERFALDALKFHLHIYTPHRPLIGYLDMFKDWYLDNNEGVDTKKSLTSLENLRRFLFPKLDSLLYTDALLLYTPAIASLSVLKIATGSTEGNVEDPTVSSLLKPLREWLENSFLSDSETAKVVENAVEMVEKCIRSVEDWSEANILYEYCLQYQNPEYISNSQLKERQKSESEEKAERKRMEKVREQRERRAGEERDLLGM